MKKILLYNSGGGLGDSIQLMDLIVSLQECFKSYDIFYLGAHENHFKGKLKEYNIKIKTLDLKLRYFGFRWWHYFRAKNNFEKYKLGKFDLIIDLQSKLRNTLILKRIPHNIFYSSTFNFRFCTKKNGNFSKNHLSNLSFIFNKKIEKIKFNLERIDDKFKNEAKKLLPNKNYIGISLTQGNKYREKSWSLTNFILLAKKIIKQNLIPVFFLEKDNINLIKQIKSEVPGALIPEINSSLACPALVTLLSTRLKMAVTIDNGIMHMISLANVPMIVLFGPTDSSKFSPKIDEIKVLDSKQIYDSKDINKISVDDVFRLI